mmetsp:Transcript_5140/g.16804  ORF Transcript_5140/g.16804 Transcript_5140/m.16804 type:complete len:268 (+) Transcript_5140:228-1031(+)|eukprot:CAMPEP_0182856678 /NCGR_PEP_ID=MMETSP0034_2-20130328/2584_1 /TAXON_ID=156128 /ORGANISM="Nephroselmis pyriformis, Strain CCMP717" /LENGTH=267 /DNA_ID=CAMNT_0024987801 /DNA_START=353 /DNA_END=1156 /DNA_ORIENTATION=+
MLIRNIIRRGAAPWRQALHGPTPGGAARAPARELSTSAAPAATSWSRRALLGALCVGGAAGAALAGVAATNEGAYRSMLFWSQAFPPYAHYRVLEWWHEDVVGSPEHVQDAAFDALHERYAPEALRVILMLKGFYVKIGQIGSTRGDFLPEIYGNAQVTVVRPSHQYRAPPGDDGHLLQPAHHELVEHGKLWKPLGAGEPRDELNPRLHALATRRGEGLGGQGQVLRGLLVAARLRDLDRDRSRRGTAGLGELRRNELSAAPRGWGS